LSKVFRLLQDRPTDWSAQSQKSCLLSQDHRKGIGHVSVALLKYFEIRAIAAKMRFDKLFAGHLKEL